MRPVSQKLFAAGSLVVLLGRASLSSCGELDAPQPTGESVAGMSACDKGTFVDQAISDPEGDASLLQSFFRTIGEMRSLSGLDRQGKAIEAYSFLLELTTNSQFECPVEREAGLQRIQFETGEDGPLIGGMEVLDTLGTIDSFRATRGATESPVFALELLYFRSLATSSLGREAETVDSLTQMILSERWISAYYEARISSEPDPYWQLEFQLESDRAMSLVGGARIQLAGRLADGRADSADVNRMLGIPPDNSALLDRQGVVGEDGQRVTIITDMDDQAIITNFGVTE